MGRETKESPNSRWGNANNGNFPCPGGSVSIFTPPSPGGRGLGGGGDEQLPPQTETNRLIAFTGVAVYSPEFLKFLPQGASSVVDAWLKAVQQGYKIGTLDVTGCHWSDIGTPIYYAKAVIEELRTSGETIYIHPSTNWCKDIELDGYVVIESESKPLCTSQSRPSPPFAKDTSPFPPFSKGGVGGFYGKNILNQGISLRNCIVLPGAMIEIKEVEDRPSTQSFANDTPTSPPFAKRGMEGLSIENCILGPGFKIDLSESEMLGLSGETNGFLIGTGGSDRQYYRVKSSGRSAVLMKCPPDDKEFQRHIEYTRFFKRTCVPVPQLIDVDSDKMSAFFEDLGDISLYSWLKCPRHEEQIERMYEEVLDILVIVHTAATKHVSECLYLTDRIFDYEHLRWETGYFMERFVEGVRNIKVNNLLTLNDEFHRLALKVDSFRKTVIHRDFQSQNIMITRGTPRLVDYQGARIGPPAYDLASILWDPYYPIDDDSRERLLNYYINEVSKICSGKHLMRTNPPSPPLLKGGKGGLLDNRDILFNETDFELTLLPCRLQRHMQALGAYGFLSKIKGKKYFLKYVPEGLRLLKEDLFLSKDEYPKLYDLTMRL
jgi:aminoglycoside/choline kinase family phosphotransferase